MLLGDDVICQVQQGKRWLEVEDYRSETVVCSYVIGGTTAIDLLVKRHESNSTYLSTLQLSPAMSGSISSVLFNQENSADSIQISFDLNFVLVNCYDVESSAMAVRNLISQYFQFSFFLNLRPRFS